MKKQETIKNTLNSGSMKVGIKRINKISKGGILLEINSKEDIGKIKMEVNLNKIYIQLKYQKS